MDQPVLIPAFSLDLAGRDPDEGMSDIAYEKGRFFLRTIEKQVGRPAWDRFLNDYFKTYAFQSMTTQGFLDFLDKQLIKGDTALANRIGIQQWIYQPGLPANCEEIHSVELQKVELQVSAFAAGTPAA